ncbi:MAG: ribonuclease J [bacterium]|nr:ribonuclease J [bacterium]
MTEQKTPVRRSSHSTHTGSSERPASAQHGPRRTSGPSSRGPRRPSNHPGGNRGPAPVHVRPVIKKQIPLQRFDDRVRVIPIGGVEEVGKNMTAIEYKDSIVIVDIGFEFPDEETMPGVDYIVPDTTYLEQRINKIKAVFITHGHLDHIGGIPYVMEKIGNPPIFTRLLTSVMIKKRQDEFPHLPTLDMRIVEKDDRIVVGDNIGVRFFNVTHTIPDAMGIIIETEWGNIVFTGDLKVDHDDGVPTAHEVETFGKLGKENNLMLLADSTNVEKPGWSFSERMVHENLEQIIINSKDRLIIGTFASLLERIIFIVGSAERAGKKVVVEGRSMKNNIAIATEVGILKIKEGTIISAQEMDDYPKDKLIILATGAQGDRYAALMRMATGAHKYVKIQKGDTILLSSSVIPGNEKSVQKLKDGLSRHGARIIHYRIADIHSSGHANRDETMWIHKQIGAKFFVPLHGYHQFLRVHEEVAIEAGIKPENVAVPDNGTVIDIMGGEKLQVYKEKVVDNVIMIDPMGKSGVNSIVIRDRKVLAQEGMFVIIATIDSNTGKVKQSPDIISRGFVYLKESQQLLREVRQLTRRTIEKSSIETRPLNYDYIKNSVREKVSRILLQHTGKRPIVIPVILEV